MAAPTVFVEVVGHAAYRIGGVVPDVPQPVAVEIYRVSSIAGGDELTIPHRPRVGSLQVFRFTSFLSNQ